MFKMEGLGSNILGCKWNNVGIYIHGSTWGMLKGHYVCIYCNMSRHVFENALIYFTIYPGKIIKK